ncbi:Eukaryotic translation initiation factor 3 subunit D [Platanthera zijinensis]|uniref:Eukaryotic translation initiation factor 3 subunit D n=1 Tax=Platanthera zijinensis TaxID=2320716 RepID=A0AAP0B8B9_9ASPA
MDILVAPYNPHGWGPPDSPVAPLLPRSDGSTPGGSAASHIPFAPFFRSDKLGRIAHWTRNTNFTNPPRSGAGRDAVFDFDSTALAAASENDSSFRLVDGKPPPRPKFGPRWRFQQRPLLPQRHDEEVEARKREAEKERARRDRHYNLNRSFVAGGGGQGPNRRDAPTLKSSVDIQPDWTMLDQISFSTFSKLSFSVPDPPDLLKQTRRF